MKSFTFLFIGLLSGHLLSAQQDFARADSMARNFKGKIDDPAVLARQLVQPFSTEAEKARVLFSWVALHIGYDVDKLRNPPAQPRFTGKTEAEMLENRRLWHEKALRKTLKGRKGLCQDYSELYQAMCLAVGLECEIVTGDARDFYKPYRAVHNNPHAWNAVKIDGSWQLVDATWGAGYVLNSKFSRKFCPGFFASQPAWFAQTHLPDKAAWQLLDQPIDGKSFPDQPIVNFGQTDYPLLGFSPKMVHSVNGTGELRFRFDLVPKAFLITGGKSNKSIPFEQTEEAGGWVVLRFSTKSLSDVTVFAGENPQREMAWLAKYDVK